MPQLRWMHSNAQMCEWVLFFNSVSSEEKVELKDSFLQHHLDVYTQHTGFVECDSVSFPWVLLAIRDTHLKSCESHGTLTCNTIQLEITLVFSKMVNVMQYGPWEQICLSLESVWILSCNRLTILQDSPCMYSYWIRPINYQQFHNLKWRKWIVNKILRLKMGETSMYTVVQHCTSARFQNWLNLCQWYGYSLSIVMYCSWCSRAKQQFEPCP